MNNPKFEILKIQWQGKPAVELVVRDSRKSPELHALVEALGYEATPDMANRRRKICTTPAEVDAARNPIAKFFDSKGEWK